MIATAEAATLVVVIDIVATVVVIIPRLGQNGNWSKMEPIIIIPFIIKIMSRG
jgi:hypothetical protein